MKKLFKKLLAMSLTAVILAGFTCSSFAEDNLSLAAQTRARHDVIYYKMIKKTTNNSDIGTAYTCGDMGTVLDADGEIIIQTIGIAENYVRVYMYGKYYSSNNNVQYLNYNYHINPPTDSYYITSSTSSVTDSEYLLDRTSLIMMKNRFGVKSTGEWYNKIMYCENQSYFWAGTCETLEN